MELYTERHGLRKPIKLTNRISEDVYVVLLDICIKYYKNLTHLYAIEQHNDFMNEDYIEFSLSKFEKRKRTKIPDLYRDERGHINQPQEDDQYALIDFIEYMAKNIRDISEGWNNDCYQNYWFINCLDTDDIFEQYRDEINEMLQESGLLYSLTDDKIVERIVENSHLTSEIEEHVDQLSEPGKHKNGVYHISHVNSLHSKFKKWITSFNGVATKYLANYLKWFKWLQIIADE